MKQAISLQVQRRELLSDWLANQKAVALRERHLRNQKEKTASAVTATPRTRPAR